MPSTDSLPRLLLVGAALLVSACPARPVALAELAFSCRASSDCVRGQICVDGTCQPSSVVAPRDAAPGDAAGLDGGHRDALANDAPGADAAAGDALRLDAPGADQLLTDTPGVDASSLDLALTDQPLADQAMAEGGAEDTSPPDGIAADAAQPDVALADTLPTDTELPDTAQPDTAVEDSQVADSWLPDTGPADACLTSGPAWWDPAYATRFELDVAAAPAGYTIEVALSGSDASALVAASLAGGLDLRVVHHAGAAVELDREVLTFAANVVLRFKIQEVGGFAGGTGAYYLYAGNAAATSAPADLRQVYLRFEDFESYAAGADGSPLYQGLPATAWRVVDDGGNKVFRAQDSGRMTLEFVGLDRQDAVLEARVRYQSFTGGTDWAALQFRATDLGLVTYTAYAGGLHRSNGQAQLRSWNTSSGSGVLDATAFAPSTGTWYRVGVKFVGSNARLAVGGSQQASISTAWTDGQRMGLTANNAHVYFDDIRVRMAQAPEPQVALGAIQQRCP